MPRNWWEVQSLKQPAPEQPQQDEGGGGLFSGVVGDVLGTAAYPFKKAGEETLKGLDWYGRRFVTPTAAWYAQLSANVNAKVGTLKDWTHLRLGQGEDTHTFWGTHLGHEHINPLKAYAGDEAEIARAEEVMSKMNPLARFITEMALDPANWATLGTQAAASGMIKSGILMMGKTGAEAKAIHEALDARELARTGFRSLLPGAKKLAKKGAQEEGILDLIHGRGAGAGGEAGRAMIAAGGILKMISGTPEILLDTFLKGGIRPITENIPGLALVIEHDTVTGLPKIRPRLIKLGDISARSQVEHVKMQTTSLLNDIRKDIEVESGGIPLGDEVNSEIMKRLADPNHDVSNYSMWSKKAFEDIHESGINLDRASMLVDAGIPGLNLQDEVADIVKNAKIATTNIATKAEIAKLSPAERFIAAATRMDKGFRLYDNKLAATWMHGVLFSPFYVMQNLVTDPILAGLTRWGMNPFAARVGYADALPNLEGILLSRTGGKRYATSAIDASGVMTHVEGDELLHEIPVMSQAMMDSGGTAGAGIIVPGFDKLANYARRIPRVGKAIAAGLRGGIRAPHAMAQGLDETFLRGAMELEYNRIFRGKLALHPNAELSRMVDKSDEIYKQLQGLGLDKQRAAAGSILWAHAASPEAFQDGMRKLANLNPGEYMDMVELDHSLIVDNQIKDGLREIIKKNSASGREGIYKGTVISYEDPVTGMRTTKVGKKTLRNKGVNQYMVQDVPKIYIKRVKDIREITRTSTKNLIDQNVTDGSARASLHALVDKAHDTFDAIEEKLIKAMTAKNVKAQDVIFHGDQMLRTSVNRQSLGRLVDDAIENMANDPNAVGYWRNTRSNLELAIGQMDKDINEFIDMSSSARKSVIQKPKADMFEDPVADPITGKMVKGKEITVNRKMWGDFRAKYDPTNILPDAPDLDALKAFVDQHQDKNWNGFFNQIYTKLRVPGRDLSVQTPYFQTIFDQVDNWTRQAIKMSDSHAANNNLIMKAAIDLSKDMPQNDKKLAAEIVSLSRDSGNRALDSAYEKMGNFYEGTTNFDELMQWMFPFSRFGTRVMSAGPRAMARTPGMLPMFYRWQHASEKVFSPIPSWMPLVGNIFVNPLNSMAPYQQFSALTDPRVFGDKDMEKLTSTLGTAGFGAGPGLTAILSQLGQMNPEGPVIPAQRAVRGLQLTGLPYSDLPDDVMTRVGNAIYARDESGEDATLLRTTEQLLADKGINPASVAKDSPEYQQARKEAIMQGVTGYFGAGTLREVPIERLQFAQKEADALAKQGVTTDQQIAMKKKGESAYSLLNEEQKNTVIAQIGEDAYRARTAIVPAGLTAEERNGWHGVQSYYVLGNIASQHLDDEIRLAGKGLMDGEFTGAEYRERKRNAFLIYNAVTDTQKRSVLSAIHGSDIQDQDKFTKEQVDELFTDMKNEIRLSAGRSVNESKMPEDDALDQFRKIDPENFMDEIGNIDWAGWSNARDAFMATSPYADYIQRVQDTKSIRDPVEQLYEQAKTEMNSYQEIPKFMSISPADQDKANEAYTAVKQLTAIGIPQDKALFMLWQKDPAASILARVALRNPNPMRTSFWKAHPLLTLFFTDNQLTPDQVTQVTDDPTQPLTEGNASSGSGKTLAQLGRLS